MLTDRQKPKSPKAECDRFWSDQDDSRRVSYSIITVFSVVFVEFSFAETVQNNCNIDYILNIPAWNSDSVDIIEINKNHYCSWSILVFICVFLLLHLYRSIISFLESDFTSSAFTWFPFRLKRLVFWILIYGWSNSVEIS